MEGPWNTEKYLNSRHLSLVTVLIVSALKLFSFFPLFSLFATQMVVIEIMSFTCKETATQ